MKPTTKLTSIVSCLALSVMPASLLAQSAPAASNSSYYVHEWGTFTTVSGSDGELLTGLHREEEALPMFVPGHAGIANVSRFKGFSYPIKGVSVKMETPVIYFYGAPQKKVQVEVGFKGGSISEWFPPRTAGEIAPKPPKAPKVKPGQKREIQYIDFSKDYTGSIKWDLEVLSRDSVDPSKYFKPGETPSWIYPSVPDSNIVKVGNTYEQYLFYRGLGNFKLPVRFTVDENETLRIENKGAEKVPYLFVYEMTRDGKTRYGSIVNGLDGKQAVEIKESDFTKVDPKRKTEIIFTEMRNGLMAQGLTFHEANGMIKTWWNSYFGHRGLRVFWVVPAQETERILPLNITPKPERITRVIVGRSEVMRPRFEQQLLAMKKEASQRLFGLDRFGLAYRERVETLRHMKKLALKK